MPTYGCNILTDGENADAADGAVDVREFDVGAFDVAEALFGVDDAPGDDNGENGVRCAALRVSWIFFSFSFLLANR